MNLDEEALLIDVPVSAPMLTPEQGKSLVTSTPVPLSASSTAMEAIDASTTPAPPGEHADPDHEKMISDEVAVHALLSHFTVWRACAYHYYNR